MVFQKPNPFPALSIFENVAVGPRLGCQRISRVLEEGSNNRLSVCALGGSRKDKLNRTGHKFIGRSAATTLYCPGSGR